MDRLPKISIITPTLNSEKTIEACILSVANQTYLNKEHLIIDGQSIDGTLSILKKHAANYPQIKWVSEKDRGIYDAMNRGIDISSGDWLYFLGSDDIFCSNTVLNNIFNLKKVSKFDVIYGNVKWGITEQLYDGPFSKFKLLKKNICHQSIFIRKRVFDRLGKYDIKYKVLSDWVFNMEWFNRRDIRHCYIDIAIARYNSDGYSKNNPDMLFRKNKGELIKAHFPKKYIFFKETISLLKAQLGEKDQVLASLWASRFRKITWPLRRAMEIYRKLHSHYHLKS